MDPKSLLEGHVLAVTAVHFVTLPSGLQVLLVASGSFLRVVSLPTCTTLYENRLLYPATIHGISIHSETLKLLCHGQRRCVLSKVSQLARNKVEVTVVAKFPAFQDYIHATTFTANGQIVVATGQGFVQLWEEVSGVVSLVVSVLSDAHRILYCAAFREAPGGEWSELALAGGTVFGELVLWYPGKRAGVVSRVKAHTGAVFCIDWSEDGKFLCSAGDDRKLTLWERSSKGALDFVQKFSAFAHKSRVWSCKLWKDVIVTTGEDSDVRVWGFDGQCLHVLLGHFGMNTWCCDVVETTGLLTTGGADASVKLWNLFALRQKKTHLHELPKHATIHAVHLLPSGALLCASGEFLLLELGVVLA